MRLHRLTATAFGPFADEVDLDLERLSSAGLFLVHGPTGSGKTSLLDAICFALYANVPGDRRATTLRSHHAAPDRATRVTLELTLGGRRLRIARSPAHERPKKRGTGTTTEPARVQLDEYVDGSWTSLSSRIDETAQVLDDLLGMALDQFRRVVMLPQGDFAAFLRTTDEERREVLERLFDVTDFVGVEQHLVERRRAVQTRLDSLRTTLAGHTLRLEELLAETDAELPELDTPLADLGTEQLVTAVREIDTALDGHASEIMALVDRAQQRATRARTALEAGQRTEELRLRGRRARISLDQLHEAAEAHTERRSRLSRARDAAAVLPHVEAVRRARRSMATARAAHDTAVAALPPVPQGTDLGALQVDLEREDDGLGSARYEADSLTRLREEEPTARSLVVERGDDVEAATRSLAATRTRADEVDTALSEVRAAEERLAEITPVITRVSDLASARSAVARGEDDHRRTTDARQAAQQTALDLRERVQALVQERLDTMAGELASQLRDGEACSVCGSLEHPAPARAVGQVTPDQIEDARTAAADGDTALEEARTLDEASGARLEVARGRVADLESELATDESGIATPPTADELSQRLERLREKRTALAAVTDRRDEVEGAAAACAKDTSRAEAARTSAVTAHTEAKAVVGRLTEETAHSASRLAAAVTAHDADCPCAGLVVTEGTPGPDLARAPEQWGPHDLETTLERMTDHHRTVLARVRHATTAQADVERATTVLDESVTLLDEAMAAHTFEDADEVEAAAVERRVMADLERRVEEHERQLASAEAVLAEDDVVAALAGEAVDLEALRAAAEQTHHEADRVARRQASAQTVLRQFVTVRDHLERACADLGPALAEAEVVTRMSALVTGTSTDNDKRMRLSTYVLAARLERIVELGNERLVGMADGRYELAHDDAAGRGQRRGGLGLLVRDLWTGQERPTDTLSGGESFTASLALALGLADAIREESGGQEFGTLFVDEGFGSLDQDSLEQVLDMLDRLRDGGRTVGVVSHVTEMRTRIPAQVRIDKTPHGSSVEVLDAATADVA